MYLLDTNIISYFFRRNPKILAKITNIPSYLIVTCSVVTGELLLGAFSEPSKKDILLAFYEEYLQRIKIFDYDFKASTVFAGIKTNLRKQGKIIEDFDMMIAAICIANDLTLVTHNTKHFERIEGLKLENWMS